MCVSDQRTGTVASGDVTLFIRHFGTPGGAPILIFHGAQYYDSADWVDVGGVLSGEPLTPLRLAGLVLCLLAILLVTYRAPIDGVRPSIRGRSRISGPPWTLMMTGRGPVNLGDGR